MLRSSLLGAMLTEAWWALISNAGAEECWEWDVGTTVTRTAAAAAGYLSAEVQESAVHRSTYYGYTYYGFASMALLTIAILCRRAPCTVVAATAATCASRWRRPLTLTLTPTLA